MATNAKVKSNSIITSAIDPNDPEVMVTRVLGVAEEIRTDRRKLAEETTLGMFWNGVKQRMADRGAMSKDPATGLPATPEAKFARIKAYNDHIMAGGAYELRTAVIRVPKGPDVGLIIRAMIRAGLVESVDVANDRLGALAAKRNITRDEAAALFERTPQVIDALAAIARESASVSVEDLMGDAEDDEQPADDDTPEDTSTDAPF